MRAWDEARAAMMGVRIEPPADTRAERLARLFPSESLTDDLVGMVAGYLVGRLAPDVDPLERARNIVSGLITHYSFEKLETAEEHAERLIR